jgi:gliding motility-associated-like protein
MVNTRINRNSKPTLISRIGKLAMLGFVMSFGISNFIFAQNLTPVPSDDNLNIFTNSGSNTVDVQANDVDDSPVIVTSIVTAPLHGTALVLSGDSIVYTPDSNFCGLDSLIYQICDNGAPSLCASATVIIIVGPVDSDGDGLNDVFETSADFDNDGVYNFLDLDSDNDGLSDFYEANQTLSCNPNPIDTDGDGKPNYLDLDSDNDGISDCVEGGAGAFDTDNDGVIDNLSAVDHNANGMPDALESAGDLDSDLDGVPNRIDLDSDNDGLGDILESGNGAFDTNGNGTMNASDAGGSDSDNDGFADAIDGFVGPGDGAGNQAETKLDVDGDGHLNAYDLDSDNDGNGDTMESGAGIIDTDDDGVIDGSDTDGDGMRNIPLFDSNATFGGDPGTQVLVGQDNDGDGAIDACDLDSDNDGIADVFENGNAALDTNNDGVIDGLDTDNDGIINVAPLDSNSTYGSQLGMMNETLIDSDLDGSINSEDLDDDNDGISDLVEVGLGSMDSNNDGIIDGTDTDGDGFINDPYLDGNTTFGCNPGVQDETTNDADGDNIYDFFDLESDGDLINDVYEGGFGALDLDDNGILDGTDTDGDGVINVSPVDSSLAYGFSIGTQNESGNPYMDADNDHHINSEDLDSDADGLPDSQEWDWNQDKLGNDDCDLNGIPNYLDPLQCDLAMPNAFSPNGDGINDTYNIQGINAYPGNKFSVFNRWGVVVFEASNYTNNWNGTSTVLGGLGGTNLPVGTYFYVLDLGNQSTKLSGYIYLNR